MDLRHETSSLVQAGAGLVVTLLVMTGIAGTAYKVISPGGWIAQAFGQSVNAGFSVLAGLSALFAFHYISRTWTPPEDRPQVTPSLAVGGFALAGLVYLAHFLATGAL